jgi:hypothetical protein
LNVRPALPAGDQVCARPDFAAQRLVGGDDLAHLCLDRGQVFLGERALGGEVVIEAIVGRRAEGDLRAGEQRLHRFGQNVGKVVAHQFQGVGLVPAVTSASAHHLRTGG